MLDTKTIENPLSLSQSLVAHSTAGYDTVRVLSNDTDFICKYYTDQIQLVINKLIPPPPQNLSGLAFVYTGTYSALQSGTGTPHSIVTNNLSFTGTISNFYDGSAGTLSAYIDSTLSGQHVITGSGDAGTYGSLVITNQADPYAGQSGKEDFWLELSAEVQPATALSLGYHSYYMVHSESGVSQTLNFWTDNPSTPTITGNSYTLPSADTLFISGVPSLKAGDPVTYAFTVNTAVGKHYNATELASLTSSYTTGLSIAPPVTPPAENAAVPYTSQIVTASTGVYSESIAFTITGYNSMGTAGIPLSQTVNARIDTVSNESTRRLSGSGQFPASGYALTFDPTQSLKTAYAEELQMIDGYYQLPYASYTSNVPTAGPDYSSGMGSLTRWCMPSFTSYNGISLSNVSSFTINIQNPQGTWSGTITSGLYIYATVNGVTGWLDCNAAYPGVGTPANNGDGAMDVSNSTVYSRRITFGPTPRTGTLYIRIGLPTGSNKKFTGITLTNVG